MARELLTDFREVEAPLTEAEAFTLDVANVVIWLLFVIDYVMRLYLTDDRRQFVRSHVLDLIVQPNPVSAQNTLGSAGEVVAATAS